MLIQVTYRNCCDANIQGFATNITLRRIAGKCLLGVRQHCLWRYNWFTDSPSSDPCLT